MGNPEDKTKARNRRANKRKERTRSYIAKDLLTEKYKQQVIKDKKKIHDLTHKELVDLIQEDGNE